MQRGALYSSGAISASEGISFGPGSTVGILGGGQLGRMFGIAARRMGYRVHAFEPHPDSPAGQISDVEVNAPYADSEALKRFARQVDVISFEFENIPLSAIKEVARLRPCARAGKFCISARIGSEKRRSWRSRAFLTPLSRSSNLRRVCARRWQPLERRQFSRRRILDTTGKAS